jgi:transposase
MQRLYAGIDLHSNNNVVVVTDAQDEVVYRKRLRNELELVVNALSPFKEELRRGVVVESTYNWYWLVDGLMEDGYRVRLANPGAIEQYSGLKYSNDESDARWLAKLLRLGILAEGYIYPKEERPVRDLLRKRSHLVRQRTSQVLSVQNLFARNTGRRLSASGVKRLSEAQVAEMVPDENLALAIESSVAVLKCLTEQVKRLEKAALKRARLREDFSRLLTVSGIGTVLGLTIMLEVGDIERFPSVGDFVSYARCVGGARISNNKKKGTVNTKNGNKYLAWAFVEAAAHGIRLNDTIRRYYQRKLAKKHLMVARKTIAHKMARACYCMLRNQEDFDVQRAFGR